MPRVKLAIGDLVEYVPNMGAEFTGHGGMGIVIRVDSNRHHPMAEIMWARFPEQGPVWFNIANLRVASSSEKL